MTVGKPSKIGDCEYCSEEVNLGTPFDLERWIIAGKAQLIVIHRECNPRADHSKDGTDADATRHPRPISGNPAGPLSGSCRFDAAADRTVGAGD
jgi:hypothetical protein